MKSYSSSEVIAALKADGWYLKRIKGDHHQFKHTVKDLNKNVLRSIERQSGLKFR